MRISTSSKPCIGLIILISFWLLTSIESVAQNEVAIGSATTKSNAILWLNGNGSQGLILPVVTNKSAVSNPDKGMVVYDDSDNKVWYRNNTAWVEVGSGTGATTASLNLLLQGNQLQLRDGTTVLNSTNIASGTQANGSFLVFNGGSWQYATLTGDATGANGAIQVNGIKGKTITTLPATAQALVYDPTANSGAGGWVFQTITNGTTIPTLNNGQLLTGNGTTNSATTITGDATLSGGVLTIGNNAITGAKINANAVDASKLADNAVTTAKINDATITGADIAANTITTDKLAQSSATSGQVLKWNGTNWVPQNETTSTPTILNNGQILTGNGTVNAATTLTGDATLSGGALTIANNAITTAKINASAVDATKIADGSVTNLKVANDAITSAKISDATITGADIAATTITGGNIAATTITADKLAQSAATSGQVLKWNGTNWIPAADDAGAGATPTLSSGQILTGDGTTNSATALTGDATLTGGAITIANNAITTAKINASSVDGTKLADNSVTSLKIADAAITGTDIAATTITGANIANTTITGTKIAAATIAGSNIANTTITGANIAATTITADKLAQSAATSGQVLKWNGSNWVPAADDAGAGATPTLNNGQILTGDGTTNSATVLTGDATLTGGAITIANNAVTTAKINANAVDGTKLADNSVTSIKIADATITGTDIAATTITGANIANTTITGTKIAAATIAGSNIANTTITGANIAATTITGANIANTTITGANIAATTITADKLAQSAATSGQVLKWNGTNWVPAADDAGVGATPTLNNGQILVGDGTTNSATALTGDATLTGGAITIANNAITTAKINANAVDGTKLADNSITSLKIADASITDADVSSSAGVAVSKLATGTNGQVLTTVGGVPIWQTPAASTDAQDLTLAGSTLSLTNDGTPVTLGGLSILNSVTTTEITNATITGADVAAATITGSNVAATTITGANIANTTITGANIAATTITADKLAQSAATSGQVLKWNGTNWVPAADDAGAGATPTLSSGQILTGDGTTNSATALTGDATLTGGAITIANNAITTAKINANAVDGTKLADNSVTSLKIADATITGADVAATTITAANIANATVTGTQIAAATITGSNIANTSITGANIAATTITGTNIANTTITGANIAATTITADKLAQSAATTGQVLKWNGTNWVPAADDAGAGATPTLSSGQILTGDGTTNSATALTGDATLAGGAITIANNAITTAKINANAVDGTKLADNSVTSLKIADATITGADIAGTTITGTNIAPATISGTNIASTTITGANIAATTITGTNIANTTITGANIAATTITADKLAQSAATTGQVLKWDGANWVPAADDAGAGATPTLSNGQILVGDGTTNSAAALTGDATLAGGVITIGNSAITSAKITDATITGADIAATTITGSNIANATITGNNIVGGTNGQVLTTVAGVPTWSTASTGTVTSITAGTGLTGGAITNSGTIAVDVGTSANKIVQLDATGKLPVIDGSQLTNLPVQVEVGDISNVVAGTGLTGGAATGAATLNVDVGTTANKIVQLDATGKLPVIDGSQLTNLPVQVEVGDISDVVAGTGLTGGGTTGAATLNVDVGTTANKIVQLDVTGKLPVIDGSQLTNLPVQVEVGDISDVVAGTGLTGGGTTGAATLNVDVGTTANKIVQLDATGKLPVVDGSQLTNLPAGITLSTTGTSGAATLVGNTLNVPNYTATTYAAGTGLTLTTNTFSVNPSQNISTLSNLTTNGLVKTSGGTGALSIATAGTDYLTPTGSAAGLTGLLPAQIPSLDAGKITTGVLPSTLGGTGLTSVVPGGVAYGGATDFAFTAAGTNGQLLQSNGTAAPSWVTVPAFLSPSLTSGNLFVGNGSNVATGVTMNGDATLTNVGLLTIANGAISGGTGGKISDLSITDADISTSAAISGTKVAPSFGAQAVSTTSTLTTGTTGQFVIDAAGNITKLNNVTTSFPATQGSAGSVLTNDGTGVLTWASASGWGLAGNALAGGEKLGSTNGNPLPFITNNAERMRIDPSGNVGIGTTTATSKLDIEGGLAVGATYSGTTAAPTDGAIIEGIVGISTNDPSNGNPYSRLVVQGGITLDNGGANAGTYEYGLVFGNGNSGEVIASNRNSGANQFGIDFYTGYANRMAITSAGDVGIGTTAPQSLLHVNGATAGSIRISNNTIGSSNTDGLFLNIDNTGEAAINTGENRNITIGANGNQVIFVTPTGLVGLNNNTPVATLDVSGQVKITDGTQGAGRVLTSDATGLATWQSASGFNTLNSIPKGDGTSLAQSALTDDGTTVTVNRLAATTIPSFAVINGNAAGDGSMRFTGGSTHYSIGSQASTGSFIISNNATGLGTFDRLAINSVGSVGIGTNTPNNKLDVEGGENTAIEVSTTGNTIQLRSAVNSVAGAEFGTATNHTLNFITGNSPRFRIGTSGELFANNSSTEGADGQVLTSQGPGLPARWENGGGGWSLTGNTVTDPLTQYVGTGDPTDLSIRTNGIERILVDATSNIVGIGTTSFGGNSMLYVNGGIQVDAGDNNTGTSTHGLTFGSNNSGEVIASQKQVGGPNQNGLDFYTGFVNRMAITASGNVGIGTATPTSKLEVAGQIKITDGTQGAGKVLTSDASGNASWQAAGAGSGWGLTGNSGTVDGTNFIGTTDNIPFSIKVNNQKSGRIEAATPFSTFYGYQAGLNSTAQANTAIGYQALTALSSSANTAVGYQAMQNTNGGQNTALGANALTANTNGTANTAIGQAVLSVQTSGNYNTGVGTLALNFNTGSGNAALGMNAAAFNSSGSNNVFVGYQAGFPNASVSNANQSGSNNTFIGANTGLGSSTQRTNATAIGANAFVDADNALVLGGTGANAVRVGIGTTTPGGRLHVENSDYNSGMILTSTAASGGAAIRFTSPASGNRIYDIIGSTGSGAATGAGSFGIYDHTNAAYRFVIGPSGNVGIGTTSPAFPLDIVTSIGFSTGTSIYFNSNTPNLDPLYQGPNGGGNVSVRASGAFLSTGSSNNGGFYVTSDERIKRKVGISDSRNDLATLMKLKVTDYKYVDSLNVGNVKVKGVFAQEVEKVYPQAISRQTNFIPNVYAMADHAEFDDVKQTLSITMTKPHNLVPGDKVKLISSTGGEKPSVVASVDGNTFTVSNWTEKSEKVFVYGKEVNDFRIVDYDRLFTLNLSATQELVKMVDEQKKMIDDLKTKEEESKKKIALLEASLNKVATGENELAALKSEIEKIKAALGLSVEASVPASKGEKKNEQ